MSDALGPISVLPRDGSRPFLPGAAEVSPETQKLVDDEVRRIVAEAHDEVVTLLTENRARLDALRVHCSKTKPAPRRESRRGGAPADVGKSEPGPAWRTTTHGRWSPLSGARAPRDRYRGGAEEPERPEAIGLSCDRPSAEVLPKNPGGAMSGTKMVATLTTARSFSCNRAAHETVRGGVDEASNS
jgi:hypothetical protein